MSTVPVPVWYALTAITTAASGAVAYQGQRKAAKAANAAADYEAARQRAEGQQEAITAAEQGRRQRLANVEELARIRARLAKSGAVPSTGTPLAVLGESAGRLELRTFDIFEQARQRADARAAAARGAIYEGGQLASSQRTAAFGTALSTAGNLVGLGLNYGRNYGSGSSTTTT